jgi:hypothetical protein
LHRIFLASGFKETVVLREDKEEDEEEALIIFIMTKKKFSSPSRSRRRGSHLHHQGLDCTEFVFSFGSA